MHTEAMAFPLLIRSLCIGRVEGRVRCTRGAAVVSVSATQLPSRLLSLRVCVCPILLYAVSHWMANLPGNRVLACVCVFVCGFNWMCGRCAKDARQGIIRECCACLFGGCVCVCSMHSSSTIIWRCVRMWGMVGDKRACVRALAIRANPHSTVWRSSAHWVGVVMAVWGGCGGGYGGGCNAGGWCSTPLSRALTTAVYDKTTLSTRMRFIVCESLHKMVKWWEIGKHHIINRSILYII